MDGFNIKTKALVIVFAIISTSKLEGLQLGNYKYNTYMTTYEVYVLASLNITKK